MNLDVLKEIFQDKSKIKVIRNYRTTHNPKNKEKTRLWLEKTVLRLGNFEAGMPLIITVVDGYVHIREADVLEIPTHHVHGRTKKDGERDPLLDVCNNEVDAVLGIGIKIDVVVKKKELIVYKEMSFKMFKGINKTEFWNDGVKKYRVVSLFSGGGAMTAGFVNTQGFESVMAIDSDIPEQNPFDYQLEGKTANYTSWTVETFKKNFPDTLFYWGDIKSVNPVYIPKADIVIISPPCVEYSGLGLKMKGLVEHFATHIVRIILETGAFAIFFENVPAYFKSQTFEKIKSMLSEVFVEWHEQDLNSYDLGAVESRNRRYVVAFRDKTIFEFPEMPQLPNNRRKKIQSFLDDESTVKWRPIEGTVMNSFLTTHKEKFAHTGFTSEKNKMLVEVKDTKVSCFVKGYGKIQSVCSYLKNPKDSSQWRPFTPNEIKRMMNYPNWFEFPNNMSVTRQLEVLGNSVNVIAVEGTASNIKTALLAHEIKMDEEKTRELDKLAQLKAELHRLTQLEAELKREQARIAKIEAEKERCLFCS